MDSENCMREANAFIEDIGKMESKLMKKSQEMYFLITQCLKLLLKHLLKFITEKQEVHKS